MSRLSVDGTTETGGTFKVPSECAMKSNTWIRVCLLPNGYLGIRKEGDPSGEVEDSLPVSGFGDVSEEVGNSLGTGQV